MRDISKNPNLHFIFDKFLKLLLRRFNFEDWMVNEERFLYRYMRPLNNGCFVDIGASFGIWTFFVANRGYTVHAFEPSPRPYKTLVKKLERYPNVYVYNVALGDKEGEESLKLHKYSTRDSLVMESNGFTGEIIKVKVKTLDSFNLENVGLIKIDTEGYELPILLGAKETILKWKPRIIIEIHKPFVEQMSKIVPLLEMLGYHVRVKHKLGIYPMLICNPINQGRFVEN